jgi:hypothetical protein
MKKRTAELPASVDALPASGRRDFYLGFEPRFYRSVDIPFNNQFRSFHNWEELEASPARGARPCHERAAMIGRIKTTMNNEQSRRIWRLLRTTMLGRRLRVRQERRAMQAVRPVWTP